MKKNKGFTLIELLAIIVILAIIAVITVPIILNIIENSRRGAAIDSAYGYKDSIQKYYVTKSVTDSTHEAPSGVKYVSELKTDGLTFLETDLSTGITTNYYIMAFGNINSKINLSKKQTNTHIIIEKTNQMIFKLISLLYQSNKDLVERNKMYSDIIIDLESKTTELIFSKN